MNKAILFIFLLLPFFAAAQQAQNTTPQPKTVGYDEQYVFNADSTALVMRMTTVQEIELSPEMTAQVLKNMQDQADLQKRALDDIEARRKKIMSLDGLRLYKKNKQNKP
ncbi:MAG: hypothetical protein ACRCVX_16185 [Shewanella sp.]